MFGTCDVGMQCYFVQDPGQLKRGWLPQRLLIDERGRYLDGFQPLQLFHLDGSYVLQRAERCPATSLDRHYVWYREDNHVGQASNRICVFPFFGVFWFFSSQTQ